MPAVGQIVEIDVTSEVQSELADDQLISFRIHQLFVANVATYKTREHTDPAMRPQLIITPVSAGQVPPEAEDISEVVLLDTLKDITLVATDANSDPLTYTIMSYPVSDQVSSHTE